MMPSAGYDVGNRNSYCWWKYKMIKATQEESLTDSYKTNYVPYDPSTILLGIYPNELKAMSTQKPAH